MHVMTIILILASHRHWTWQSTLFKKIKRVEIFLIPIRRNNIRRKAISVQQSRLFVEIVLINERDEGRVRTIKLHAASGGVRATTPDVPPSHRPRPVSPSLTIGAHRKQRLWQFKSLVATHRPLLSTSRFRYI